MVRVEALLAEAPDDEKLLERQMGGPSRVFCNALKRKQAEGDCSQAESHAEKEKDVGGTVVGGG